MHLGQVRDTLTQIAEGEEAWDGSRKSAHEAFVECIKWVAAEFVDRNESMAEIPHLGDRPDWRRMPDKAYKLLLLIDRVLVLEGKPTVSNDPVFTEPQAIPVAPAYPRAPASDAKPDGVSDAIWTRYLEGGGITAQQFAEVAECTEREVRKAIDIIRVVYQSDSPLHPINHQRRWWAAKELSAQGLDLQPTARGTLKVVAATDTGERPAKTSYKAHSKGELLEEVKQLLGDHPDAEKVVLEVVSRIDESFAARQGYRDAVKNAKGLKDRAENTLREAVELGREVGNTNAAEVKLDGIETSWQALEEAKGKGSEIRAEARARKKRADAALESLMLNLRQLELPGIV